MENSRVLYPLYVMLHPFDGYGEMKWGKGKGSVPVALFVLALLFTSNIAIRQGTGFVFNNNRPDKLNILLELAYTAIPFLLWVISNWSFCTLMDGEGKFREICIFSAYALTPLVVFTVPAVILSNFMILQEGTFLNLYNSVLKIWTFVLMVIAMKEVHQYSIKKTFASMALTVVGMAIIIFLAMLILSLFQQLFIFISTVYSEIMYRI